ncbi:hypothetical protein [uncultured Dubosiella sp.]|uniref:hypothetical protein n=1 Tax=uncultured Dubosiella sp. TaxID=1937011 RepID=UPI0025965C8D|nr:hypothetical protein [uncultured Dubosiella sp.]
MIDHGMAYWEIREIPRKVNQHWVADSMADQLEKDRIIEVLKRELGNREELDDLKFDLEQEENMRWAVEMNLDECEEENESLKSKLKQIEAAWIKMTGEKFKYEKF